MDALIDLLHSHEFAISLAASLGWVIFYALFRGVAWVLSKLTVVVPVRIWIRNLLEGVHLKEPHQLVQAASSSSLDIPRVEAECKMIESGIVSLERFLDELDLGRKKIYRMLRSQEVKADVTSVLQNEIKELYATQALLQSFVGEKSTQLAALQRLSAFPNLQGRVTVLVFFISSMDLDLAGAAIHSLAECVESEEAYRKLEDLDTRGVPRLRMARKEALQRMRERLTTSEK